MKKNSRKQNMLFGKKCVRLGLLLTFFFFEKGYTQIPTNTDPAKNFVNVNIPKTPESGAFEKYGSAQVNEFTGTTNIAVPIYNLRSRFLEVPITLSYQATGIKITQEASWVGLGFDLIAGGRITVETRGCVDFSASTVGLTTSNLQTGMTQIFNRLGNHGENAILTPATYWEPPAPCSGCPADPNLYNGVGISEMTQYGTGEPDIFRANFLGHSVTFYVDKISNTINFLGEQSNFRINYTLDSYHNITGWTIVDDDGITYYFNQTETTTNSLTSSAIVPATTTSSWLLTQILHPSGDYIQFTYNNYGYAVPAFTMSGSVDVATQGGTTVSSDQNQNVSIQSPYYLTRVESADVAVDFVLDTRTDLYGPGSRKLTQIRVTDKLNNSLKKTATFNYSYFQGTADGGIHNYLNTLFYSLPSPLSQSAYLASSNTRLKLDSIYVNDSTKQPPYRFYYNNSFTPDKYSYSQDHWGYYNGISNQANGYAFSHLIPYFGLQGIQNYQPPSGYGFNNSSVGNNRDCDPNYIQAMMLDSIVYPTGGSTKFTYEPHQSTMLPTVSVTGGGLRVKLIKNYTGGNLAGTTEYSYSYGKYMGTINYYTTSLVLSRCNGEAVLAIAHYKYSSNGAVNDNEILIGYGSISVIQKNAAQQTNGSLIKTFNISSSSSNYSNAIGFDIQAPYFPPGEPNSNFVISNLDPQHKNFPPTPAANLEGKLTREDYYDDANNLLKAINYYYHLANYTNNFFDIKAIQNRVGGFENPNCGEGYNVNIGYASGGNRPVILFVSPAKSFHAVTDSIVEKTYQGANFIVQKRSFTYDSKYQVRSETNYNSDGTEKTISYTRPYDYLSTGINGNTTLIYEMTGRNMNSTIFTTTVKQNGVQTDSILNLYHKPSTGVFVPENTQIQIRNNPMEIRQTYNAYDNYGNLLEKQKPGGLKENYLWGYDKKFPVAYVVGSDYSTIAGIVDAAILNNPSTDVALRTELNKLRAHLPNALVTTYTYDRVYGMTSETDPAGRTKYYDYDGLGRLSLVRDQDKNVIKKICYSYTGQQESCLSLYYNIQKTGNFTRNNCAAGATGQTITYIVPAGKYSSTTSQELADQFAQDEVNAYGQAYANANGTCTWRNAEQGGYFTRNNCPAGATGSMVYYLVAANTYSSTTSQAAADQLAINDVNANGQNYANTNGSCTWWNTQQSGTFTPNNCAAGYAGGSITYTVAATTYNSTISQAAADQLAINDVNANGQNYANTQGTCTAGCSFTMFSGWSKVTSGMSASMPAGGSTHTVSYFISFYYTTGNANWNTGNVNTIAMISSTCRPSTDQQSPPLLAAGCTWRVTVTASGLFRVERLSGTAPTGQTVISLTNGSYSW